MFFSVQHIRHTPTKTLQDVDIGTLYAHGLQVLCIVREKAVGSVSQCGRLIKQFCCGKLHICRRRDVFFVAQPRMKVSYVSDLCLLNLSLGMYYLSIPLFWNILFWGLFTSITSSVVSFVAIINLGVSLDIAKARFSDTVFSLWISLLQ